MSDLSIKQYSYLTVSSKVLTSQEIEDTLKLKADKHTFWGKGRLRMDPTYQISNVWELIVNESTRVDDQIELLIKRVLPVKDRLVELKRSTDIEVSISVVRHFDDPEGEHEMIDEDAEFIKLPGQHQLLGWHLSTKVIKFLHETEAEIDIDEYN